MSYPLVIDWDYIRKKVRDKRGVDSYRVLAKQFPDLSAATLQRFLSSNTELDLKSLLCLMNVLELELFGVFVEKPRQKTLFDRDTTKSH